MLERKAAKISCRRKIIKWATKLGIKRKAKGKRREREKNVEIESQKFKFTVYQIPVAACSITHKFVTSSVNYS